MSLNPCPCLWSAPSQDISSSQVLWVTIGILLPFDNPVTLVVLKQALHPLSGRGNLVTQLLVHLQTRPSLSLVSILYLSSWTSTLSSWTITLSLYSLSSTKREIVSLSHKTVFVMLKQCSNVLHIILENVLMLFGSVQHQLLCCCYFNWHVGGGVLICKNDSQHDSKHYPTGAGTETTAHTLTHLNATEDPHHLQIT